MTIYKRKRYNKYIYITGKVIPGEVDNTLIECQGTDLNIPFYITEETLEWKFRKLTKSELRKYEKDTK